MSFTNVLCPSIHPYTQVLGFFMYQFVANFVLEPIALQCFRSAALDLFARVLSVWTLTID